MRIATSRAPLVAAALLVLGLSATAAESEIRTEQVHFKPGKSGATVKGKIKGYEGVDYVLEASAGQQMSVSMATDNLSSYFNVMLPGESEAAVFIGSTSGTQYEGTLPKSGDYKIRVYMMRNAARRDEVANYRLEMIVTGTPDQGATSTGTSKGDALVKGTDYHATGNVPCAMGGGAPTGSCAFGVRRKGRGSGTVTVTKPDGRTRAIVFENGRATGADVSAADPGDFKTEKQGDLSIVRIGQERYEIPDAVILGG